MRRIPESWTVGIAVSVSALISLINSLAFFLGIIRRPEGTVYLGTVHYWEDYFFYLNHFYQGAHGAWLTVNRFTPEATEPTIIYWTNVMGGKLFGLLGMDPILAYNINLIILTFLALFLTFVLLRRIVGKPGLALIGFLIASTASSLQNRVTASDGSMIFWPFQIWKTPHFAFDRLGGVPHQTLVTVLVNAFFIIYLYPKAKRRMLRVLALAVLAVTITTIQLAQGSIIVAFLLFAEAIGALKQRRIDKDVLGTFAIITPLTAITALFMYRLFDLAPHIQTKIWEASQHSFTTLPFLLLSIGPVIMLAAIGVAARIRTFQPIHWYGLLTIISGYVLFFSSIPQAIGISNVRLLFPATYAFWGLFGAMGIDAIASFMQRRWHTGKSLLYVLLTATYLLLTIPTLAWEIGMKTKSAGDRNDMLIYLPVSIAQSFGWLMSSDPDGIVMANPKTRLDALVPGLSGHTTYSGHMLQTTDNAARQAEAQRVFAGMITGEELRAWLQSVNIRYILMTTYDGDIAAFQRQNPFLTKLFSNDRAVVFGVTP